MGKKKQNIIVWVLLLCIMLTLAPQAALAVLIEELSIGSSRDIATDNEWNALTHINALRHAEGLAPLAMAACIQQVAALRARELAQSFSSTRPNGMPWDTAIDEAEIPYTKAAELTAHFFLSGQNVVESWANTEDRRASLLGDYYTHIGLSHNLNADTWAAVLIGTHSHEYLALHPSGNRHITAGRPFSSLGLIAVAEGELGESYIPLTDAVVTGFNRYRPGVQAVTFSVGDLSISFYIEVRFVDVNYNTRQATYIRYVVQRGLFNGVSGTHFSPDESMTRDMLVTVLGRQARQMGFAIAGDHTRFADVADDRWYTAYIGWAAEQGIALGYAGNFNGKEVLTREQLAVFLLRFVAFSEAELTLEGRYTPDYTDRHLVSYWASDAVDATLALGFFELLGDTFFAPQRYATRMEVARAITILVRDFIGDCDDDDITNGGPGNNGGSDDDDNDEQ
ncbi:MAG: S-layer homology domain-containing protein [Oscillospiraceae bacterium]|nr:S-layer homology domain-containing protein [Oscillospiraceae bacterium]